MNAWILVYRYFTFHKFKWNSPDSWFGDISRQGQPRKWCGVFGFLNGFCINQSHAVGTMWAQGKLLSVPAPRVFHSRRPGPECLSDSSTVTHEASGKQDVRSAGFQSCVLSLCLVKQKLLSHEGVQLKQTSRLQPIWLWLQTVWRGMWLQGSWGLWPAQSKHRTSDREACLAQKGPRLCKVLRVF